MRRLAAVVSLALLFVVVGCEQDSDQDVTYVTPTEDIAESSDISEAPAGYQGLKSLCPIVAACDMGFTVSTCEAEFLGYCASEASKTGYVNCMSGCHEGYTEVQNCETFKNCETQCWTGSGC